MTTVDLHPEHLLDALRAGALSSADRARLEAHCARCAVCLFELRWLDTGLVARETTAEDRAYGEAAFDNVLRATRRAPPTLPPRLRLRWGVGGVLLGVGLSGVLLIGPAPWSRPERRPSVATATELRVPALAPIETSPVEPPPQMPMSQPVITPPSAASTPSANSLLAAARRASVHRQLERAKGLYRQVIERYPATAAAGAAQVAMGRLLDTELAQPRAAIDSFEAYLRRHPHGELAEEAQYYRALALERVGRRDEARSSLREFVSAFPHSLYAAPARARLARNSQ
jgi:Tetratricopeptide repeat